jgi:hypothetical protein
MQLFNIQYDFGNRYNLIVLLGTTINVNLKCVAIVGLIVGSVGYFVRRSTRKCPLCD